MEKTLRTLTWLLIGLGLAEVFWLLPHPLLLLPFLLLIYPTVKAKRKLFCTWILIVALSSVCATFWSCWDARFIHLSTLNLWPAQTAILESLVIFPTLLAARRQ